MAIEQQREEKKGAPEWVVTFGDMMSLLLCFFVLLLSFSTLETERFKIVAGYIREAFGVNSARRYTEIPSGMTVVAVEFNQPSKSKAAIFERVIDLMKDLGNQEYSEVESEEEGVRITMESELLFPPGSATLTRDALPVLDEIAQVAQDWKGYVVVEGHSDNTPIHSSLYPSNWELAGARSTAVVRHFISRGFAAERIEAISYGDARPVTENYTEEGRRKNRRVEILIHTDR